MGPREDSRETRVVFALHAVLHFLGNAASSRSRPRFRPSKRQTISDFVTHSLSLPLQRFPVGLT
jgi:hypothetical protein